MFGINPKNDVYTKVSRKKDLYSGFRTATTTMKGIDENICVRPIFTGHTTRMHHLFHMVQSLLVQSESNNNLIMIHWFLNVNINSQIYITA